MAAPQPRGQSTTVSLTFPPTDDRGAPSRTAGAGERGQGCISGNIPLTALSPTNNIVTTVAANPTLFWYVPQTNAKSAEFVIVDPQGNEVYLTHVVLPNAPGIMKLSLPATTSLKLGTSYTWQLALICNPAERSSDAYVRGMINRVELSPPQSTMLKAVTDPLKQAEVYAQAKIWQETLTILAQLHHDRPNDSTVNAAWQELLKSVQLDAITSAPLVECCTADSAPK